MMTTTTTTTTMMMMHYSEGTSRVEPVDRVEGIQRTRSKWFERTRRTRRVVRGRRFRGLNLEGLGWTY
jgi:hypothetical protein